MTMNEIKNNEIDNLEYNIAWAHAHKEEIELTGVTVEEYIACDVKKLAELTKEDRKHY